MDSICLKIWQRQTKKEKRGVRTATKKATDITSDCISSGSLGVVEIWKTEAITTTIFIQGVYCPDELFSVTWYQASTVWLNRWQYAARHYAQSKGTKTGTAGVKNGISSVCFPLFQMRIASLHRKISATTGYSYLIYNLHLKTFFSVVKDKKVCIYWCIRLPGVFFLTAITLHVYVGLLWFDLHPHSQSKQELS